MQPVVLETVAALRTWREAERKAGRRVGLVPTMGALHRGHASLVTAVQRTCDSVVASIFVNPAQFAPNEDFARYPRTFEADLAILNQVGCRAVFAPEVAAMYPPGFATSVQLEGPAKVGLEDAFRPTHFAGVATVVTKLLLQCLPDVAIFGEKDYQQLSVIRQMVRDLDIPVTITGGETIREADGLALSSRNAYLSVDERSRAALISQVLKDCANAIRAGGSPSGIAATGAAKLTSAGFAVDYLAVRDAQTLREPAPGAEPRPLRILVAATLGKTRLIDNMAV